MESQPSVLQLVKWLTSHTRDVHKPLYVSTLFRLVNLSMDIVLFALGTRDVVASAATAINMLGPAVSTLVFRDPLSPLRRWAVVSSSALSFSCPAGEASPSAVKKGGPQHSATERRKSIENDSSGYGRRTPGQ